MNILRLGSDAHEFDIIIHSQDLATSLGFDVLLCNILALVVE